MAAEKEDPAVLEKIREVESESCGRASCQAALVSPPKIPNFWVLMARTFMFEVGRRLVERALPNMQVVVMPKVDLGTILAEPKPKSPIIDDAKGPGSGGSSGCGSSGGYH
jgi:hypothetical protein